MLLDYGIDVCHILSFTPLGLVYDLAGVALIGLAFFDDTPPSYSVPSNQGTDLDMVFTRSTPATVDGQAGTVLLGLGFLFQIGGSLDCCLTPAVIVGGPGLVLFLIFWFAWGKDYRTKTWEAWIEKDFVRLRKLNQKKGPDNQGTR